MILIWSGEGGPLQYLSLVVFFLQFFTPQIFQLIFEIQNGHLEIGPFPYARVASFLSFVSVIFIGGLWVSGLLLPDEDEHVDHGNGAPAAAEEAPAPGSAPVPATASETAENTVAPGQQGDGDDGFTAWAGERIYSAFSATSPAYLVLALGFFLPLAMAAPLILNGLQSEGLFGFLEYSGVIQMTVLAIIAHSMMAVAAYRLLQDVLDGEEGVGPYPGNQRGRRRRRGRRLTVSEISDIVRKVPVEEFCSPATVKTGACSTERLKRMLVNRGAGEVAHKCLEKDDLANEIIKVRNFNNECPICAEEYVEGDILRVTRCQHEFHLHCFDKWIYSFSTNSRPATHPTCPLCKATV